MSGQGDTKSGPLFIPAVSSRVQALIKAGYYEPPKQLESSEERELNEAFAQIWSAVGGGTRDEEGLRAMLVVLTSALISVNSPAGLCALYRFASSNGSSLASLQDRVDRAGLMREAGIKCIIIIGGPKPINCLGALRASLEDDVKKKLDSVRSSRESLPQHQVIDNGAKLFNSIYSPHADELLGRLRECHPDFGDFVIQHAYGGLLSSVPFHPTSQAVHHRQPNVHRTFASVLMMACVRAQGGAGPQLTGHVYGLLKAGEEMDENGDGNAVEKWLATEDGAEWVMRSVDRVCELVGDRSTRRGT